MDEDCAFGMDVATALMQGFLGQRDDRASFRSFVGQRGIERRLGQCWRPDAWCGDKG